MMEASRLRRDGFTVKQIAKLIGVSQTTIKRYFAIEAARYRATMPENFEAAAEYLKARYEKLFARAEAEFDRSREDAVEVEQEREAESGKPPEEWKITKTKTKRKGRVGDNSLLETCRKILKDFRDMYGIDQESPAQAASGGQITNLFQLVIQSQKARQAVVEADGTLAVEGPEEGNGESEKENDDD